MNRPVYIIGAGGIVNDAHLPAYRAARFNTAGIYDLSEERAHSTAKRFAIPTVFSSLQSMVDAAPKDAVFDIAVPASSIFGVLEQLPPKATILIQKPMGSDLHEGSRILQLVRSMEQTAAVNFQLRYAPAIVKARKLIGEGMLGTLCDIEINVNVYTPWQLWTFLYDAPRVEILYHSIHYIDLIRSFLGNPQSVYARTVKHPVMSQLASVRSTIIMDYGDMVRATILTNHSHRFGEKHQQAYVKFEGTQGAIKINLGVLKNYPHGEADRFEYVFLNDTGDPRWQVLEVDGTWFPDAFAESLKELTNSIAENRMPRHSVEDCIYTMACVEAAYQSSEAGGVRPDRLIWA